MLRNLHSDLDKEKGWNNKFKNSIIIAVEQSFQYSKIMNRIHASNGGKLVDRKNNDGNKKRRVNRRNIYKLLQIMNHIKNKGERSKKQGGKRKKRH